MFGQLQPINAQDGLTAPRPEPQVGKPARTPRWACTRLTAIALLTASFALLVAACAAPTSKLTIAAVEVTASDRIGPVILGIGGAIDNSLAIQGLPAPARPVQPDFIVRVGVWSACASTGDGDPKSNACTGKLQKDFHNVLYNKTTVYPDRPSTSELTFKDSVPIIQSAAEAMKGLGPTLVSVAVAAGLTGYVLYFSCLSFFSYARPACWAAIPAQNRVLTHPGVGLCLMVFCFFTTGLAWTFSAMILMAVSEMRLEQYTVLVTQGGASILISLAALLQLFAICCQYSIYRHLVADHYTQEGAPPADGNESFVTEQPTVLPGLSHAISTAPSPVRPQFTIGTVDDKKDAPQFTIGSTEDKKDDGIFSAQSEEAAPPRYSLHKDMAATFLAGKGQEAKSDEKVELSEDKDAKGN